MKDKGEKISMLTAYDYSTAKIIDDAGIDVILVGDSASNVMAGHDSTLPITLDQMIYHAQSVIRAVDRALGSGGSSLWFPTKETAARP
jgi:3-methyl-2-oxobutanoate hydroxymethyltransferase